MEELEKEIDAPAEGEAALLEKVARLSKIVRALRSQLALYEQKQDAEIDAPRLDKIMEGLRNHESPSQAMAIAMRYYNPILLAENFNHASGVELAKQIYLYFSSLSNESLNPTIWKEYVNNNSPVPIFD